MLKSVVQQFLKTRALPLVAACIIAVATLAGGYFGSPRVVHVAAGTPDADEELRKEFQEALETVQDGYAGRLDLELLGKASIQGMLHQLDPHSTFFTKREFDDMQTEQSSRTYGIGVTISKRYDRVYILSVTPDGPSWRAGLRYGDAILAIDKQNVEDWTTEKVMYAVRGEKGDSIEITVERAGVPSPITFSIKRDEVKLPTVRNAFMVNQSSVGYIALTGGFSARTDEEVSEAMTHLKQEGMRQLVLDLRDNPGGLLDEAIKVAMKFLPPGEKIVEVRGRDEEAAPSIHRVLDNNVPETMPIVILINRRTASASEVVAGALQDHDRALIVGENSFGKGLVQGVFRLWGGTGLVLTTARYYTPTGRLIQRNYANMSFYDYYFNRGEAEHPDAGRGDALHTDAGRLVYGGGGITPDIESKAPEAGAVRGRLFYGAFHFVRQLAAGQVTGMREYRIGETQYKTRLSADDLNRFPITDALVAAFRAYLATKPPFNISEAQFNGKLDYIRSQLRRELISAAYGADAGDQVYLADDVQFRKAVDSLDQARALADNARRARAASQP
ncbi:MAG: carboxyl-terminal processing protease [Blastocatellia bacterium]